MKKLIIIGLLAVAWLAFSQAPAQAQLFRRNNSTVAINQGGGGQQIASIQQRSGLFGGLLGGRTNITAINQGGGVGGQSVANVGRRGGVVAINQNNGGFVNGNRVLVNNGYGLNSSRVFINGGYGYRNSAFIVNGGYRGYNLNSLAFYNANPFFINYAPLYSQGFLVNDAGCCGGVVNVNAYGGCGVGATGYGFRTFSGCY